MSAGFKPRHRTARACFFLIEAVLAALWWKSLLGWPWLAPPAVLYAALLVNGASRIDSGFFIDAFCGADTELKEIAITFDDGPHPEFTPKVLAALAEYGAPAAFFVIGRKIRGNEELLQRMAAAGHEIGNHSFTHSLWIDFKTAASFEEEIRRTFDELERTLGKRTSLFRPPYGVTTPRLAKAAAALNCRLIGWNVRSLDTTRDGEDVIERRVRGQLKPGAIVLFHDASDKTVRVLTRTLRHARERGYKVVGVERLLSLSAAGSDARRP